MESEVIGAAWGGFFRQPLRKAIWVLIAWIGFGVNSAAAQSYEAGAAAYVKRDYTEALEQWMPLARGGDIFAQHGLGLLYQASPSLAGDPDPDAGLKESAFWYGKAAERGFPPSMNNLAFMKARGQGATRNTGQAIALWTQAAEADYAEAAYNLGLVYLRGQYVEKDSGVALKWLTKAAEQNFPAAQYALGELYYTGEGVPQNLASARDWYQKAAAGRFEAAAVRLNAIEAVSGPAPEAAEASPASSVSPVATPPDAPAPNVQDTLPVAESEPESEPVRPEEPLAAEITGVDVQVMQQRPGFEGAGPGVNVWLHSLRSEANARASWMKMRELYGSLLTGISARVARVDMGSEGIWFRIYAGPFSNEASARQLCQKLKTAKPRADCVIVVN